MIILVNMHKDWWNDRGGILEHIHSIPRSVSSNDVNLFVRVKPHDIFQRDLLIRHKCTSATIARRDLKIDQMDMDGMRPTTSSVLQRPVGQVSKLVVLVKA